MNTYCIAYDGGLKFIIKFSPPFNRLQTFSSSFETKIHKNIKPIIILRLKVYFTKILSKWHEKTSRFINDPRG